MARALKPNHRPSSQQSMGLPGSASHKRLLSDIRSLVEQARAQTARAANTALVGLYWHIGKRIREDVLRHRRAEYGEQVVAALSNQLTTEFGRGFSKQNLFRMMRFAEVFPDEQIVSSLVRQLLWTRPLTPVP